MRSLTYIFHLCLLPLFSIGQCSNNIIYNGSFELDSTGSGVVSQGWEGYVDPDLHSIDSQKPSSQWEWTGNLSLSSQGGNWQNLGGIESISQEVTLQKGLRYLVSFEFVNQPITSDIWETTTVDTAEIVVFINGNLAHRTGYDLSPYSWETSCFSFVADSTQSLVTFTTNGFLNTYVALDNICIVRDEEHFDFPNNYDYCLGEELEVGVSDESYTEILWSTGSSDNPLVIQEEGEYWVDIVRECDTRREIFEVKGRDCGCSLYVPTAFSPSSDGLDATFEVGSSCPLESYGLSIYDSWGNEVFYSDSIDDSWDGSFKNKALLSGNYSFLLNYQFKDSMRYETGVLTLFK